MKHITLTLLIQIFILAIVADGQAKTIQLPAFDIVEAVQKARQFVQDRKIDVTHHFVLSAEYKNLHNEREKGFWEITWALAAGSSGSRIILRVSQDGSVKLSDIRSAAEPEHAPKGPTTKPTLPAANDIIGFAADKQEVPEKVRMTDKGLKEILATWHSVTNEQWSGRYSHMDLLDQTGTITLRDETTIRWLVRAGGLARLTLPDGSHVYLAKGIPQ